MTCASAQLLIEEELDRPLDAEESGALRAHLAECEGCALRRRELQRIAALLTGLDDSGLPDATWRGMVTEAVCEAESTRRRGVVRGLALLAAAAALVLACWMAWRHTRPGADPGPQRPVAPRAVAHAPGASVPAPGPEADGPKAGEDRTPDRPQPAPSARRPRRHGPGGALASHSPGEPAIGPAAEAQPGLSAGDVALIYETALGLAGDGGRLGAPVEVVAAARQRVVSGDLAEAIVSYEVAVEASVRSPITPGRPTEPPRTTLSEEASLPWSAQDVLMAWAPSPEVVGR